MQFRHSRRWPGVEPRFFARHLARNLLPTPSCPALLAAVDSPVLTALPAWVAHLCAPATGPATHTAAACESPVRRPIAANCNPSSDPQLVACLPNSNADTSFLASFAAPWGVFCCLILGGHSNRDGDSGNSTDGFSVKTASITARCGRKDARPATGDNCNDDSKRETQRGYPQDHAAPGWR